MKRILPCPFLRDFWGKYVAGRDWNKISKEISEIYNSLDWEIEYNTDTSAGHPVKDDDIVRYSLETRRVKDKEP